MKMISIGNDLFEELLEYCIELRGEWAWKRNSFHAHPRTELQYLSQAIEKGLQVRKSNENNN